MKHRLQLWIRRVLIWRAQHLPMQHFIFILSILTGLISGLVAVVLKNSTHAIQAWISSERFEDYYQLYYFGFPLVGILLTVVLVRVFKLQAGEGIPSAIEAISRQGGIIPRSRMYTSFLTSVVTVGFGGSVGLEGPAVGTGSAIGSNLARWMRLGFKQRILLIACATAGAISSIFGAPVAAIIFTLELFSIDLTLSSLVPLLLASATGALTGLMTSDGSKLFYAEGIEAFDPINLPYYLILGVACALVSLYFKRIFALSGRLVMRYDNPWVKAATGGILLGALIFVMPPLYGEGFSTIQAALRGDDWSILSQNWLGVEEGNLLLGIGLLVGLLLLKVTAASLTVHAGGVGGMFAPTLFMGSILGLIFVRTLNLMGIHDLPVVHFVLIAMAGLMAGTMHAPLTAIFLISEIGGGYPLILPLMMTSALSFFLTRNWDPNSIYTEYLSQRGKQWTQSKDKAVLTLLDMDDVLERDLETLGPDNTLDECQAALARCHRNLLAIIEDGRMVGYITWEDIWRAQREDHTETITAKDAMKSAPTRIQYGDAMDIVLTQMEKSGMWYLPVYQEGKWLGLVSKSKLFEAYRKQIQDLSHEV
ncbi:MAG TPA: chloride channel protein [Cryomorphaceae bacterium]|jgi:chloride channel protein, CIC family|nr:chloride channel protein [Cryomorphaceae bacterium]HAB31109.1 chloride channel protein [Cryomorphaceae bacterium]HAG49185.1 chloride channel protein [Cryomorphaceae bacterium]|tara:strand:- start:688 stop:2463 length:1776 start_codon:yes stop_codon:yes gene_type:complete